MSCMPLTPEEQDKLYEKTTKRARTLINQLNRYATNNLNCSICEDGSMLMESGVPDAYYADKKTLKELKLHLEFVLRNLD